MTPDALYAVFIGIIAGLSEGASLWSVHICSSFFSVLSTKLRDNMEKGETFCMPALGGMGTKTLQLEGHRTVRSAVVTAFKKLNDEEERLGGHYPTLVSLCMGSTTKSRLEAAYGYGDSFFSQLKGRYIIIVDPWRNKHYSNTAIVNPTQTIRTESQCPLVEG